MKTYEQELPERYKEIYHINAANKKTGLLLTLWSFVILVVVFAITIAIVGFGYFDDIEFNPSSLIVMDIVFIVIMLSYIVLHELVHGIAYKTLTKQKLTFGLKWSCAYCGVPDIYVYRRTALISLVSPLIVFSFVYVVAIIVCALISSFYIYIFVFMLAMHLSGCVGDIYMTYLLLTKYKEPTTLMRDTGPEQWLYQKQ